jgi:hypothetical protein
VKKFVQDDAWAIQAKLKAEVVKGSRHHTHVRFWHDGKVVIQFGIRRGSGELGHGHLPKNMQLSQPECRQFRICTLSVERYIEILKKKGVISS